MEDLEVEQLMTIVESEDRLTIAQNNLQRIADKARINALGWGGSIVLGVGNS